MKSRIWTLSWSQINRSLAKSLIPANERVKKSMVQGGGEQQRPFSLPYPLADMAILSGNLAKARLREKDRMRGNIPLFSRTLPLTRTASGPASPTGGEAGCGVISEVRGFFHTLESGNPSAITCNSNSLHSISAAAPGERLGSGPKIWIGIPRRAMRPAPLSIPHTSHSRGTSFLSLQPPGAHAHRRAYRADGSLSLRG